ncbi:unnamed protein product [Chrysoparadoxa australica]
MSLPRRQLDPLQGINPPDPAPSPMDSQDQDGDYFPPRQEDDAASPKISGVQAMAVDDAEGEVSREEVMNLYETVKLGLEASATVSQLG